MLLKIMLKISCYRKIVFCLSKLAILRQQLRTRQKSTHLKLKKLCMTSASSTNKKIVSDYGSKNWIRSISITKLFILTKNLGQWILTKLCGRLWFQNRKWVVLSKILKLFGSILTLLISWQSIKQDTTSRTNLNGLIGLYTIQISDTHQCQPVIS